MQRTLRKLLLLALLLPAGGAAQELGEIPLADVLEVLVLDRELVAIDAEGGGQRTLRLRLDERVLWTGSRGRVGVVMTDQRILAVAVGSAAWQEEARLREEELPQRALLGDRVALLRTSRRIVGFDGGSGNLVETSLGLREQVRAESVGGNTALVVTNRRALGLSPFTGGFFEVPIQLEERLESAEAGANLATVTTNRRVLVFRAPSGSWEERHRGLGR